MSVYIVADMRLNDAVAAQGIGKSIEEYNQFIVDRINSVVTKEDSIIFLGIIAVDNNNIKPYIDQINGSKDCCDLNRQKIFNTTEKLQEIGIEHGYSLDCFTKDKVNDVNYYVIISSTIDYVAYMGLIQDLDTEYYWAMPESAKRMKKRLDDRILNISLDQWEYYPIKYSELPYIIDNMKWFESMGDI